MSSPNAGGTTRDLIRPPLDPVVAEPRLVAEGEAPADGEPVGGEPARSARTTPRGFRDFGVVGWIGALLMLGVLALATYGILTQPRF